MNTELLQGNKVAEVIQVLRAGKDFYQHLNRQVNDHDIQQVISNMIKQHDLAIHDLQSFIVPKPNASERESLAKIIVNIYGQLIEVISFERLHVFVDQLEELENKTIRLIDAAITMPQPQIYKQYLQRVRVSIQECHDQIKLL